MRTVKTDQTRDLPRLISVFSVRKCHTVEHGDRNYNSTEQKLSFIFLACIIYIPLNNTVFGPEHSLFC